MSCPGAGDQFAAGFLYGLMREYPLKKCAQLGCLAGGAVVQVVGAEMTQASWRWLFARCTTICLCLNNLLSNLLSLACCINVLGNCLLLIAICQ